MNTKQPHPWKKILLSSSLIIFSVVYVLWQNILKNANDTSSVTNTTTTENTSYEKMPLTVTQTPVDQTPSATQTQTAQQKILYTDGSFTGSIADAFYGMVQVKVTIANGKINNVQFLQYPNEHEHSREINRRAMPILTQETIAAQSARIDGVSGASETSRAFKESLSAALALAQK